MKGRLILTSMTLIAIVLSIIGGLSPTRASAASITYGVCEFYYGSFTSAATQRILNTLPEMLVANTAGGSYGLYCPVSSFQNAGIKVFSYISVGRLSEFKYAWDSPPNDYATVMSEVRAVKAEGCYGVFLDESTTSADTPGSYSWYGYTMRDITDLAHSLGLKVIIGEGGAHFNNNLFEIGDYVLSDEWYADDGTCRSPQVGEIQHPERCIVIGSGGVYSSATAATRTVGALSKGFGYAYHLSSLATMESWFEDYMAQVRYTTRYTPYNVALSVSGSGTTSPASGTYGPYTIGAGFDIVARPNSGYVFDHWAGDITGTANPMTFQINSNLSLQAVFVPGGSGGTPSLYEKSYESNSQDNLSGAAWKGQSFTPKTTHTITKVRLPLIRTNNPSGNVVVTIRRTDSNGLPTGGDLASGSIPCSLVSTSWEQQWYNISLGAGCQLTAGTKYALIVQAPSATSSLYYWANSAGTCSGGAVVYTYNGGASWSSYTGWDMVFEEWGVQGTSPMIPLAITTTSLPNGTAGVSYSQTLAASGGATPYTWSLSSGSLPANLSLNASTGVISGTPGAAATSTFTVKVTDSTGTTSTQALSLTVSAASTATPVRYETYTSSNTQDNIGGTAWKGQTFIPASTHNITKVRLPLLNPNSQSGNVTVSIRNTDASGLPTGSDLASGSIACSTLITAWGPVTWYDFNLGAGCQLTAGTKYALIIQAPSAASGIYYWANTAGTYGNGAVVYTYNGGSSWSSYSGWDASFEEWGTTNTPTNPVPTTSGISPSTRTVGDTAFTLTINGTNFLSGSVVNFNGSARTTTYVSAAQLTAAIPATDLTTAGTYNITVLNPTPGGGTSNAQSLIVNAAASNPVPTTSSILPTTKTAGSAAFTLTVNGTNFLNSSVVRFAGSTRTTTFVSTTQLTAAIPASDLTTAGTYNITVFNPTPGGGTSNVQSFTVTSQTQQAALYESFITSNDQDNLGGTIWKGQTFTPAVTHTVTKVRLPLLNPNSQSGNVVVSIRNTDASGLPTGSDLASGSIACSTLITAWGPVTWYDFNLGAGCQLTAGTKYALIVQAPSAASSIYYWANTAGAYGNGGVVYTYNGGTSWGSYTGWDMVFEEWGVQGTSPMIPLAITTTSLPNGTAGVSYSQTLAASGGATPYTWSLSSGSLPANLSLNASTGVISGTPTAAATSTFTVKVTGSTGTTSTAALALTINAANITPVRFENYSTSNNQDNLGGTTWKGQTFIPAANHTLTKVRLPLLNPNSQSGNVTVSIRRTDASGLPTGSDLASGSIACSALITAWGPVTWYDFNLGTGCQLTAGTKYALIVQAPSAASGIYYWANTAGAYGSGAVVYTYNGGSSWSSYSGWDMVFEEWGY